MKKFLGLMLALALALTACSALADAEGAIVQSSCSIVQSGEYYLVYCFAQVHNNTNDTICLEQGTFDLQSGEQVLSTSKVNQIWPYFIGPGEDGYLFDIVSFEPDENGNPVVPQITGIAYQIDYMVVDPAFANHHLDTEPTLEVDPAGGLSILCRVQNNTDMDAFNPTVAFGLYTENGAMIYADGTTLQDVGIPAGGSMLLRFDVEDEFAAQWKQAGFMPQSVKVNAAFRNDED